MFTGGDIFAQLQDPRPAKIRDGGGLLAPFSKPSCCSGYLSVLLKATYSGADVQPAAAGTFGVRRCCSIADLLCPMQDCISEGWALLSLFSGWRSHTFW